MVTKFVKQSSTLDANEALASLYSSVHEQPAGDRVKFFTDEEPCVMQDPSMKQPRLRVKQTFVLMKKGTSGSSERRIGVMVAVWSPESNRMAHHTFWDMAKIELGRHEDL